MHNYAQANYHEDEFANRKDQNHAPAAFGARFNA